MRYLSSIPNRPLDEFIERFWQINDAPPHHKERIMPSGTFELVINLREDEFRIYDPMRPERYKRFAGAIVSGAYQGSFGIDAHQHASVIGVHFRPGGAFPFLGPAAGDLADTHVDLEALWGSSAVELRERLCAATNPRDRFRLLEKALLSHLLRPQEHHAAVGFALNAFGRANSSLTIREVVKDTGLSQRRFIQLFKREVGLSPKRFCRVRRFQQALSSMRLTKAPDWAQMVVNCGFFDQAHLINEFRGFSGLSPTEYLSRQSERVMENHVPLAG